MKNIKWIIAISIFLTNCHSIETISVSQNYIKYNFTPVSIEKKIENFNIKILPINPQKLNEETYIASIADGSFENEFVNIINNKENELNKTSNYSSKELIKSKINALEKLLLLENDKKIPSNISNLLMKRIWYGYKYANNGSEIKSLTNNTYPDTYNPYKVNDKNLSVYKLSFENKSDSIANIYIKNFQILNGESVLYPFKNDYFENYLKGNSEQLKNIYRLNLPEELLITPSQRISKYIAIPTINPIDNKVVIQYIQNSKVENFNFAIQKEEIRNIYNFEEFKINIKWKKNGSYDYYYAIEFNDRFFCTYNNTFFADKQKDVTVNVYIIAFQPYFENIFFYKKNNIQLKELSNNILLMRIKS